MLDLESGDSGAKLKPKGSTKEPTSGPTPGGNVIKIETREGSMNSDTITYFFSGSEEMPLITVEETKLDGPCTHSTGLTVTIQEPGMEELSCHQHHSRVEKKGPPGYDESEQVTGEPRAVKAKLQEIATVLEKSESVDKFLDLFPGAFKIRQLLNSEPDRECKVGPKKLS
ncbi:unnamed protein product [Durusdinium trenchii]|uniref:Uncharacterized protein n=2 Tax=Durusdinium trenchii TaxID=1381693 RepID=A0ABP0N7R8_9DINO